MARKDHTFALRGGLDLQNQPLSIRDGHAIACRNYEPVETGYALIDGFERFDGQDSPTDVPIYVINFDAGDTAIDAGDTVEGGTSGATGVVLGDATISSGDYGSGNAAGFVIVRSLVGTFVDNEDLEVSSTKVAEVNGVPTAASSSNTTIIDQYYIAREWQRTQIAEVPGSGPVRGVLDGMAGDVVYAWRDNAGETACVLHKSSAAGWVEITPGKTLDFTSGSAVAEGDVIEGATSGATATVERVIVQTGSLGGGDAEGYLVLSGVSGTFQAENLDTTTPVASNVATIAGDADAITFPAGGNYGFKINNFYAGANTRRAYGWNGVGEAFEFDGTVVAPIRTTQDTDTPTFGAVHQNHLILAFPGGAVSVSGLGDPFSYSAVTGALALGLGAEIVDMKAANQGLMTFFCDTKIAILTGDSYANWDLDVLTDEAGAKTRTAQRIGRMFYMDNRGLRSMTETEATGNFRMGTKSGKVFNFLKRKREAGIEPVNSCVVRNKDHYRLFFEDGTGLSFLMDRRELSALPFDLGKTVNCISSAELSTGVERVLFGSTEDGYVYHLDKGISFDGTLRDAFAQLNFIHMGLPRQNKRLHGIEIEIEADPQAVIGVLPEFDYGSSEQLSAALETLTVTGGGGLWNVAEWNRFAWSLPLEGRAEVDLDGQGANVSFVIACTAENQRRHVLQGIMVDYSPRGRKR